jgi:hypothetical protein
MKKMLLVVYEPRQIEIDLMAIFGHFEVFIISDGV